LSTQKQNHRQSGDNKRKYLAFSHACLRSLRAAFCNSGNCRAQRYS
jgi:hypothetical protein